MNKPSKRYMVDLHYYHRQGVPTVWIPLTLSLSHTHTISPYWSSLIVSLQDEIQCPHRTDECVAVTDLFSLANQSLTKRFGHTLINQRAECTDSFLLSRTIFSISFWKLASRTESTRPAKKKDLSPIASHGKPALTIFTEDNCCHRYPLKKITAATSYTHKITNAATCNALTN